MPDFVNITIDGKPRRVDPAKNLLQNCIDLGLLVPHFCYHEALGAVGACRLCAAMVAPTADKPARITMTCMTMPTEGMVVEIIAPDARRFRHGVIEDLMLNHPHDCPVCDEGGECMLQDMTVLVEHQHRRKRFAKRTWRNQDLGPLIQHEMNRCIQCYRCVRFYRDYALGNDLGVFGVHDRLYFGRVRDGVLKSPFAGNLVDVCPTGVFTNKRFRRVYCRPWDLVTADAVCVHCSVGCSVMPGVSHSLYRRTKPRGNEAVNKFFMCDRGRFGPEYLNSVSRLSKANVDGKATPLSKALESVAVRLREITRTYGADSIAALGSARSTLEANATLRFVMDSLGAKRIAFFSSDAERETVRAAAAITASRRFPTPSLAQIEDADFILSLGGDLTAEAPMLDLAVRQAIRKNASCFVVSPRAGEMDALASAALRTRPGEEKQVVASILADGEISDEAAQIKERLGKSKRPLILCSALHGDAKLVEGAASLAEHATLEGRPCMLAYYYPAANAAGLGLIKEDTPPERLWKEAGIKALIVLERNPAEDPDSESAFLEAAAVCEFVVTIDCYENATTAVSTASLACATHYQTAGTLVNYECRAQATGSLNMPSPALPSSREILLRLAETLGDSSVRTRSCGGLYAITDDNAKELESLKPGQTGILLHGTAEVLPPRPFAETAYAENGACLWRIVEMFGSEELSSLAPPVAELAGRCRVELSSEEAARRHLKAGQQVDLVQELGISGEVRLNAALADHTVAVPVIWKQPTGLREDTK